jgi:NAD+ kinase
MVHTRPKLIVFGDTRKGHVVEAIKEFVGFCDCRAEIIANCSITECSTVDFSMAKFAVVFGGDGSILAAARTLVQAAIPIIGVNVGKLGYLAEFNVGEVKKLWDRIISDEKLVEPRMMLKCEVVRDGVVRFSDAAVNDVVINAGPQFRMIELQVCVDGSPLAGCVGDGLIISTPTGSTAYNLSAGGPILAADISAMVVTPICPHSLSFRPIVVGAERKVEVHTLHLNEGTTVTLDGQVSNSLNVGDVIRIEKHRGMLKVVSNPMRTQWDTLAGKLNWAGRPNYSGENRV